MLGFFYAGQPYAGQSGYATTITLVIADSTHAHNVDSLALEQHYTLAIADALHAHMARHSPPRMPDDDEIRLIQQNVLAIADTLHADSAEQSNAFPTFSLTINDALHADNADNITVTVPGLLVPNNTVHSHSADNIDLVQQYALAVQDASHTHAADSVNVNILMLIQDSSHGHTADNVAVRLKYKPTAPQPLADPRKPKLVQYTPRLVRIAVRQDQQPVASASSGPRIKIANDKVRFTE